MDKENLKKELFELYEKLERDKELYKEFIENEDKFLQDRGYDPSEVKKLFQGITEERNNILKNVLEDSSYYNDNINGKWYKKPEHIREGRNYGK